MVAETPKLEIRMLGQFSLARGGAPLTVGSRAAQALLAYLVLTAGSRHRRERLTGLLWPDVEEVSARQSLRNALWTLRKTLGEGYLLADKISVGFDPASRYELDAAALEIDEASPTEALMAAGAAYGGELLPGFYDDWILLERERLRAGYDRSMAALLERLQAEGRAHDVLVWAERWIAQGQAPEPAYRALMTAHHSLGDHAGMVSAYRRCARAMEEELGVEPSPETERLYERYLSEPLAARPPALEPIPEAAVSPPLPAFLQASDEQQPPGVKVVGREPELARLTGFLEQALAGQGRVAFVTGEAGRGKTSLLSELSRRAQEAHPELLVALGHCNAFSGAGDPFLPFRDALEMLTGDVESKWLAGTIDRRQAERLWRFLPGALTAVAEEGPELLDGFLRRNALLRRAATRDPGGRLEALLASSSGAVEAGRQERARLFEAYTQVLRAISAAHPLLLLLEDLHWADPSSIALLFHLARRLGGARILLIGSYRAEDVAVEEQSEPLRLPGLVAELERTLGAIRVDLGSSAAGRAFIDPLLDSEPNRLGAAFRERLASLTEGHPLFAVELLEELKAGGGLQRDDSGLWTESPELSWQALPARVEGVIRTRVERLEDDLREALVVGSVEGETFTAEAVARVLGVDARLLARRLSGEAERRHQLVEGLELRRVGGQRLSRYRFRHNLFQQFLYNGLSRLDRAVLHEEVGVALEGLHGPTSAEIAVDLARHFLEGGLDEKAARYLLLAGKRAVELSAHEEALAHLRRGLRLAAALPNDAAAVSHELESRLLLGSALQALQGYSAPEVAEEFERARELADRLGASRQQFTASWSLSLFHTQHAEFPRARELGGALIHLAEREGDPGLLLQAHHALWFAAASMGDFQAALAHAEQGEALYDPREYGDHASRYGGHDPGACARLFAARALWFLGCPDRALAHAREALALTASLERPDSLAHAFAHAAEIHLLRREGAAAAELAGRTIEVAGSKGLSYWLAWGTILRGCALDVQGLADEAIREICRGRDSYPKLGALEEVTSLGRLAQAYANAGQVADGLGTLDAAFRAASRLDAPIWSADLLRVRGELLHLRGGSEEEARECFRGSIAIARRHEAASLELRAALSYGKAVRAGDGTSEGLEYLATAYGRFTEGFETADLEEARALLAAAA